MQAVRECGAGGKVPPADADAWMRGRHQRDGDANVLAAAQDVFAIEQTEGQADQRRVGSKRDVALLPRQTDANHLLALVVTARDVAHVAHGGGVRSGGRARQRKARHLQPLGETGQVVVLLLGGAVFLDELTWAQRVRDHDIGAHVGRARGELAQHQRLRLRREAQTAVLLGNEHAKEAVFLDERPISSEISFSLWRMAQSSTMRQSSVTGPSRKAFSSSVKVMGGTARSFSQLGSPENSSASKPMVPALSASCSVAETRGKMPLILWNSGATSTARRRDGMESPARIRTGTQATKPRELNAGACQSPWMRPVRQPRTAAAAAAAQPQIGALRMASQK